MFCEQIQVKRGKSGCPTYGEEYCKEEDGRCLRSPQRKTRREENIRILAQKPLPVAAVIRKCSVFPPLPQANLEMGIDMSVGHGFCAFREPRKQHPWDDERRASGLGKLGCDLVHPS